MIKKTVPYRSISKRVQAIRMLSKHILALTGLVFTCVSGIHAFAQVAGADPGNPLWELHTPKEYNAHGQNFAVVQDKRGVMYFGNFAGVLEYDGTTWRTIPTHNYAKVSSLFLDQATGTIFVGANSEFGYLKPNAKGTLYFESLSDGLKTSFGEITNIIKTREGIHFIGKKNIYLWKNRIIKEWKTEDPIQGTFELNGKIYFYQKKRGLTLFQDNTLTPVRTNARLPALLDIAAMFLLNDQSILVVSSNQGLFKITDNYLDQFNCPANSYLIANQVSTGLRLLDKSLALSTLQGGIIVLNEKGSMVQLIQGNSFEDVQVNSMFQSKGGLLWLALNDGIMQVDIPSPMSVFNDAVGIKGEVNSILRYNNTLYIATLNGLYAIDGFRSNPVSNLKASCFALEATPKAMLAATSKGVYQVRGGGARALTNDFSICLHSLRSNPSVVFIGLDNGLAILDLSRGSYRQVPAIDDQIIGISEDNNGMIWLETLSNGLYRTNAGAYQWKQYSDKDGLGTLLYNQTLNSSEGLIAWNKNGTFKYEPDKDRFAAYNLFKTDTTSTLYWKGQIVQDQKGNFWTTRGDEKLISQYKKDEKNSYEEIAKPFRAFSDRTFKTIYPESDSIVWFGGPDGAIRFNLRQSDDFLKSYPALIRKINLKADSLTFNGYKGASASPQNPDNIRISYDYNDISFQFSAASFNVGEELAFRYFLENYDDTWSEWTSQNQKEYTNLSPGRYRFRVKARNIYNIESEEAVVEFVIQRPWYRMWWAFLLYFIVLGVILYYLVRWRLRSLVKVKDQLESMIVERTEEISSQKEELEKQSLELASKNDQLEKIDQIVQSINSEIEFTSLFETVLAKLNIIRNMDTATALLYDKETDSFRFKAAFGNIELSQLEDMQLSLQQAEERYLENAVEKAEDIYFKTDTQFNLPDKVFEKIPIPRSLITIVINVEGKVEGFITIENTSRINAFDQSDFDMIRNLKEHLVSAFIKTRILENLEKTLTNLKLAQEELIRQERLASVGQLTRGIVDRILNPLNYINNFSESSQGLVEEIAELVEDKELAIPEGLKDDFQDDLEMLKVNLIKIKEHGNSTTRIVKDMQRLLKEKSNEFFETDVNGFVESKTQIAIQELKIENKEKEVDLEVEFNLETPSVQVRVLPFEMSSVISNLINNAYYSMTEKKKVVKGYSPRLIVGTNTMGKYVYISFKDNGKGIPKKEMEQMFSPFFTTKPTSKGTGLGLYMSKDIIELHKGEIEIKSTEGEFVLITIRLPIIEP